MQTALQHHQAGHLTEAEKRYRQVLKIDPEHVDALHLLGVLAHQMGHPHYAVELIQRAITKNPLIAEFHGHLGDALRALNRLEEAINAYYRAIQLKPEYQLVCGNLLGNSLKMLGRFDEAVTLYQQLLQQLPNHEALHSNLGSIYRELGKSELAIQHFTQALAIKPDYFNAHNNLANLLMSEGQLERSRYHFEQALALEPHNAEVHSNLGSLLFQSQEQLEPALQYYDRALALKPELIEIHSNKARLFLLSGNFAPAWIEHLWRPTRLDYFKNAPFSDKVPTLSLNLQNQHLLLQSEQGIGDELFFLRFAPQLKTRGALLTYRYGSTKLLSILRRLSWLTLIAPMTTFTADHTILIGDLPLALDMQNVTQIPPPLPLSALPERVEAMRHRLVQLGPPPFLGLTWRAGTSLQERLEKAPTRQFLSKEISLTALAPTLKLIKATIIVLQRQPKAGELNQLAELLERPVYDLSDLNDQLEDMLALLSLLNGYVGVSNTNTHLMAGLGKMAHVLVPHPPEWRWMISGNESPWFPGFKVYRQTVDKEWSNALQQLTQDLSHEF